jgi:1,4-alpha-glucan branching enzyme
MNHADAPPWIRAAGLTEHDVYLFREGSHRRLYEKLGARVARIDGTTGVSFAVWAPNAAAVSMIGDFNGWDKTAHPVQSRADESGDWATLCCRSWRRRRVWKC